MYNRNHSLSHVESNDVIQPEGVVSIFYGGAIEADNGASAEIHKTNIASIRDAGGAVELTHHAYFTREERQEVLESATGMPLDMIYSVKLSPYGRAANVRHATLRPLKDGTLDAAIFEVTAQSIGTGMEIAYASDRPEMIPFIALHDKRRGEPTVGVLPYGRSALIEYDSDEMRDELILEFVHTVKKHQPDKSEMSWPFTAYSEAKKQSAYKVMNEFIGRTIMRGNGNVVLISGKHAELDPDNPAIFDVSEPSTIVGKKIGRACLQTPTPPMLCLHREDVRPTVMVRGLPSTYAAVLPYASMTERAEIKGMFIQALQEHTGVNFDPIKAVINRVRDTEGHTSTA